MEIAGSYTFNASRQRVWEKLMDSAILSACLPGVESLDETGECKYAATISMGVGPIRGRYEAKVSLQDLDLHSSYRLVIEGSGSLGFANGSALITLAERDGSTVVEVKGDAQVGGTVARVGQRMMGSVAKGALDRFMGCIGEAIEQA